MPSDGRALAWLLALLVVLAPVVVGAGPGAAPGATANETVPGGSGAAVAGVLGQHGEHLDGTFRRSAFRRDLAAAGSSGERAAVVAEYRNESAARLDALRQRQATLETARDNGSLAPGAYEARAREVWAAARSLQRLATDIEAAAANISREDLREAGVSRDAVERLRRGAADLAERSRPADVADPFGPGFYADVRALVENYNDGAGDAGRLGRQLQDEHVELVVTADGQRAVVSFRVDGGGQIRDLRAGGHEDPTVRMRTGRATVGRLADADDAPAALQRAVREGDLTVSGVGPVNAVKWAVVDWLMGL